MKAIKECLLIDDDQDDQEVFLLCVNKISKDINCKAIDTAVDAVSMLATNDEYIPDYIFVDVNMPKMNGIDCLKHLKRIDRLKHTKIFMYSTSSDNEIIEASKELGADEFIIKPAKFIELKETLSEIFRNYLE